MSTKQRALAKITKIGATLDDSGESFILDAPDFMLFGVDHSYVYDVSDGIKDPFSGTTVWQSILEDLNQPLERCIDKYCDMCIEAKAKV
jgi:hypothetical protein